MLDFEKILAGEPKFRKKQVKQLVFCDLIENWSEATTMPESLRKTLDEKCPLKIEAEIFESKDGQTAKALITLDDGLKIESVLMRHAERGEGDAQRPGKKRNTICISSQVGCPLGCVFCATGQAGFKRNLTSWEIVEQVLFFARLLKKENQKVTNIVFMGMGEPFLNYDNVLAAIKILNDKEGLNLGARHYSISTVGIPGGIQKLAQEKLEVNLAISLHASNDALRSKIIPANKQYPIGEIFKAVDNYIKKTHRRVMLEYIMIKNVNDSEVCARELAKIAKRPICFVNLISYNPTGIFEASSEAQIKKFKKILEEQNVQVTRRWRFGSDIQAACGQLVAGQAEKNNE